MSNNIIEKKVFRKCIPRSFKDRIQPIWVSLLIFLLDLFCVLALFSGYTYFSSSPQAIFESTSCKILIVVGLILFFLCILLTMCICSINSDFAYELTINDSALIYEDRFTCQTIKLPCSSEKTSDTILLSDGTTELIIPYGEIKDHDLLEFLKDIIN
jgi:hypothetical protein